MYTEIALSQKKYFHAQGISLYLLNWTCVLQSSALDTTWARHVIKKCHVLSLCPIQCTETLVKALDGSAFNVPDLGLGIYILAFLSLFKIEYI